MITVHERLRLARVRRRMTQREVGATFDPPVTHAAISDIERGTTRLTLDLLAALADRYDASRRWLLEDWLDEVQ